MEIRTIGIGLGKTVFHLVGANTRGDVVVRKKFSRTQLLRLTSNLGQGFDRQGGPRRISFSGRFAGTRARRTPDAGAQYVKPYVKTNKNGLH